MKSLRSIKSMPSYNRVNYNAMQCAYDLWAHITDDQSYTLIGGQDYQVTPVLKMSAFGQLIYKSRQNKPRLRDKQLAKTKKTPDKLLSLLIFCVGIQLPCQQLISTHDRLVKNSSRTFHIRAHLQEY